MSTAEFSQGGTLIVVSRVGPEMVGLTVHVTAEDGNGITLLCMTAPREECEVGIGFAPWLDGQPTMRIGPAVLPLATAIEAAQVATPANTAPATGTRPPIRDPWASPDPDLGEQYARGRVREGTSMGIPIDPATGRPESTPKGGISNPPPAIAPLAAPIIPPWSNPAKGETTTPTPALIRTAVEQQVAAQYQHNGKTALNTPMLSRAWGVPQKDIARITREVRASFAPASATATATHTEPGQPPQPATPSVVAESAQTVARASGITMAQAKGNVLSQIDAALERANTDAWPDIPEGVNAARSGARQVAENERDRITRAAGFVTFDVPGDGTFRVVNNRSRLEAFRTQVERQFKNPQPPRGPQLPRIGMSEAERTRIMAEAETLDGDTPMFSRASVVQAQPDAKGLPVANVERIARDFMRSYRGNIPLDVKVGRTLEELYGPNTAELGTAKGAYHPRSRVLTLAADRLSSRTMSKPPCATKSWVTTASTLWHRLTRRPFLTRS